MRDEELVFHHDAPYVVTLQDGSQLDGTLARYDGCFMVEHARFAAWEIDDAFVDTGELTPMRLS
jgi:hypothetical protein